MVQQIKVEYAVSVRQACRAVDLNASSYYYEKLANEDGEVVESFVRLSGMYQTEGFWKLFGRMRQEGMVVNHKRAHRIYCQMGLNIRRKKKRRVPERPKEPLEVPASINDTWSIDFMADSLCTGRKFRTLNVLDDYNREALAVEADISLSAERVIRVLERIIFFRGKPLRFRVDNGPEFTSVAFTLWCASQGIEIRYIQPGKPVQNAFIERFNRSYRQDVLNAYWFEKLSEVRRITQQWVEDYNSNRPHEALGNLSPRAYAAGLLTVENAPAFTTINSLDHGD